MERSALTLASISWDFAPLNLFSASGRTASATRPRLWPASFFCFCLVFFSDRTQVWAQGSPGVYSFTADHRNPLIKTAGDLPTSRGEASFMNKMFHQGESLLVNMRPQINGSDVTEKQNKLKFN